MENLVTGSEQIDLGNSKHDTSRCWCNVAEGRKRTSIVCVLFVIQMIGIADLF